MKSEFSTYLELGLRHIADVQAYDHILFVIAMCIGYELRYWKPLLILVTAFTLGHSLTLALSALDIIRFPSAVVEFLIPVTILITAAVQFFRDSAKPPVFTLRDYLLPFCFGFIHGMGFSNYFKSLLGQEESILFPLFSFNIGIEIGQLLIVGLFMVITWIGISKIGLPKGIWRKSISGIILCFALYLMWETKFW
jgi:hypothetical protein